MISVIRAWMWRMGDLASLFERLESARPTDAAMPWDRRGSGLRDSVLANIQIILNQRQGCCQTRLDLGLPDLNGLPRYFGGDPRPRAHREDATRFLRAAPAGRGRSAHHAAGDAGRTDFPGLRDPSRARRRGGPCSSRPCSATTVRCACAHKREALTTIIALREGSPSRSANADRFEHGGPCRSTPITRTNCPTCANWGRNSRKRTPNWQGSCPEATDPDVERLLEGFAFSVARLRQKLDDEMPEFATAYQAHLAAIPATAAAHEHRGLRCRGGRRGRRPRSPRHRPRVGGRSKRLVPVPHLLPGRCAAVHGPSTPRARAEATLRSFPLPCVRQGVRR